MEPVETKDSHKLSATCFLRNGCQICVRFGCTSDLAQEDIESLLACVGTLAA